MSHKAPGTSFPVSSIEKDFIRREWDLAVLLNFRDQHYPDQRLAYIGLPGGRMLDLLTWRELLGRKTAIQADRSPGERTIADELVRNVLLNRMEDSFRLIRGEIDDILLDGNAAQSLAMPYHIVNLDYTGGLVHSTKSLESRRLDALEAIFRYQRETAFILLLTLNLRDNDEGEFLDRISRWEDDLSGREGVRKTIQAHQAEYGNAGLIKIYLPNYLGDIADRHALEFEPPIYYQGTRPMIHFVVTCLPYTRRTGGRRMTVQERVDAINLPICLLDERRGSLQLYEGALPKIT